MIEKIIHGDSQEELIRACGRMIQVYESGRHIKEAASRLFPRSELEKYAPPPGKFMSHAVTMGSSEMYGPNRNFDRWGNSELLKKHATFVTHAKNYREHRNKDPKKALGEIKAEKYDKDLQRGEIVFWTDIDKAPEEFEKARAGEEQHGSMAACFPGYAQVLMADGTEKAIRDLRVGDAVRTHKGAVGLVSRTLQREYADTGISFRAYGLPDTVTSTAEHPIWVRPTLKKTSICPVCGSRFSSLRAHLRQKQDSKHQAAYRNFERYAEGWKRADQLVPGDFVRTPFDTTVEEYGDPVFAALLGWYLAEGSVFDSAKYSPAHWSVDFTLGIHEPHYASEIRDLLHRSGIEERQISVYEQPAKSRIIVRCRNTALMGKLIAAGGKLAGGKMISPEIMRWDPRVQQIILEKAIEGDGHWHKELHKPILTTVSRRLAWQMAEIAWRAGFPATLGVSKSSVGETHELFDAGGGSHSVTNKLSAYLISIPREFADRLNLVKKPDGFSVDTRPYETASGHLKNHKEGSVMQRKRQTCKLHYIEGGFVYHRLYRIRQVFLQETVYDLTVPGDHGFVVTGVGVSNCVDHDVCECCGFKSKYANQRCTHIRDTPGRYIPEFRKYANMINVDPTFKDYSWVKRPADRIAHTLHYFMPREKAASVGREPRGDELAFLYGADSPWLEPMRKLAAFDSSPGDPVKRASFDWVFPRAFNGQFDSDLVDRMASHPWPARVLASLAKKAMVMPLATFNSFVTGVPLAASQADPVVVEAREKMASIRVTIIRRLASDPEFAGDFDSASNEFQEAGCGCGDMIDGMMEKAREQFSVRYEDLAKRAAYNPLAKRVEGAAPASPGAFALGTLYNAYLARQAAASDDWQTHGMLATL